MGVGRARDTCERLQAMTPMGSSAPQDLAEVYRTTYRALVRFLYRKVWDAERAEDLAQEAFARALVHKPENARGWLFIVAANMARDDARRAARERRHLTLLTAEPQESALASDEAIEVESDRARVQAALDELSPRDREALLLWDSGLSYEEIAAQTGLARGASGTTLSRARRRLLQAYDPGKPREHAARGCAHAARGSGRACSGGSQRNANGRHPARHSAERRDAGPGPRPAGGVRNGRWCARGEGVSHQPRQRACATRSRSPRRPRCADPHDVSGTRNRLLRPRDRGAGARFEHGNRGGERAPVPASRRRGCGHRSSSARGASRQRDRGRAGVTESRQDRGLARRRSGREGGRSSAAPRRQSRNSNLGPTAERFPAEAVAGRPAGEALATALP